MLRKATLNINLTERRSKPPIQPGLSLHHLKRQLLSFNPAQGSHNLLIAKLIKVYCEWKREQTCGAARGAIVCVPPNTSGLSDVSKVAGGRGEEWRGGASFVYES